MAKKSGSLFGRADATLVQAAIIEGRTKGPADYTGVYKTMSENYASMADDLMKEAKETYEAIYKDQIALKEKFDPAYDMLQKGNFDDQQRAEYFDMLEDYRTRYEEVNKIRDRKERKKAEIALNSEFNAFQKNLPLMETELAKIATFVANDQHVVGGMEGRFGYTNTENTNFLIGIADFHNKVDDPKFPTTRTIEKGKVFYEVDVGTTKVKLDQDQMSKLLPIQDHNAKRQLNEVYNLAKTAGGTKGQKYDPNFISNRIFDIVGSSKTPADTWQTIARYKSDYGEESFYDALHDPKSILGEQIKAALLNSNLPKEFDVDGREGITEGDFLNKDNFKKIQKYIMNNPRFGAKVMADWGAATNGHAAFKVGEGILNAKGNPNNVPGTGFLSTKKGINSGTLKYFFLPTYDDAKRVYDQFKLASEGKDAEFSAAGAVYTFKTTGDNAYKWVETKSGGIKTVKGTTEDLIGPRGFGIKDSDFLAIKNFVSEATEKPNGLPTQASRAEGTYSTISGLEEIINFDTLQTTDDELSKTLNNIIPTPGQKTDQNEGGYYFGPSIDTGLLRGLTNPLIGGDDPFVNAIMLYDVNGNPVKYPGTENYVFFKHRGEDRENAIITIDNILKEFGFDKNINTSKLLDE
tara:strand:- start:693 stop:2597 length:1905 start_codon:yes stop_codon:yes gene_type:complete